MRSLRISERPALCSLALGALHALLFWLSFPPVFAWPLAFVSLWPLLYIAWKTPRPARSALMVGIAVLPMWLALHWWMIDVTAAGFPVLGLYLSLYAFLFVWIAARWRRRVGDGRRFWLALPVLWIGLEMLRGAVVWHGYPWYLLGHPTISLTHPAASLVGAYGVSLLVALFSVRAFELAFVRPVGGRRAIVSALLGAFIVGALLLGGGLRPGAFAETAEIAVVQTNVPQSNRVGWSIDQKIEDFRAFAAMTREAAQASPDLIIWPETMFPGLTLNADAVAVERDAGIVYPGGLQTTAFYDELLRLQAELGVPMLVGAIARDGLSIDIDREGRVQLHAAATYNSAFLIDNGAVSDTRYDKLHLTPFGEFMPYISWNDWLEEKLLALGAAGMSFDLDAGHGPRQLTLHRSGDDSEWRTLRIAAPICFEATMPAVCRRLVFRNDERTADVMINLTNDGWFGGSLAGRRNHELAARWRCAELRTSMVRAANTGVSSVITPDGGVTARLPAMTAGALVHAVPLPSTSRIEPLYALIGDLVGWLCLAASGGLFLGAVLPRRTGANPPRTVEEAPGAPTKDTPDDRAQGATAP